MNEYIFRSQDYRLFATEIYDVFGDWTFFTVKVGQPTVGVENNVRRFPAVQDSGLKLLN